VINHGEHPPTIEVFSLSDDAETLTFKRTIAHPLLRTPNSVQPVSDHEIYVSNDHFYEVRDHPILAKLENFAHIAKGNVVYLNLKTNEAKVVTEFSFPNGVAQLNSTHLAIASTTSLAVNVFEIQSDHSLNKTLHIQADFWVDNLRVDSAGKLLLTGHPYALLLEGVAKNQHKYNLDTGRRDGLDPSARPKTGSWVAEWDGNAEGKIKNLYIDDGSEYGTSTTAVRDVGRGVGFVVGLYDKGILQFEA
jgi:arylesterase/paraoxonase